MARWLNLCLLFFGLAVFSGGCASSSSPRNDGQFGRYRPDISDRDPASWSAPETPTSQPPATSPPRKPNKLVEKEREIVTRSGEPVSLLKSGDEVLVLLKDIPREDEITETVDERGWIKLPYLKNVKVSGKSTSDAETMIENAYISQGYFKKITVVIRKQDDNFYITGEVKREGQYSIAGEITLSRAIALSAGFTDFARQEAVQINRGDDVFIFNMKKIRDNKADDPVIISGDEIHVPRKTILN